MKNEEYQDYVDLIFKKYLVKVLYFSVTVSTIGFTAWFIYDDSITPIHEVLSTLIMALMLIAGYYFMYLFARYGYVIYNMLMSAGKSTHSNINESIEQSKQEFKDIRQKHNQNDAVEK